MKCGVAWPSALTDSTGMFTVRRTPLRNAVVPQHPPVQFAEPYCACVVPLMTRSTGG